MPWSNRQLLKMGYSFKNFKLFFGFLNVQGIALRVFSADTIIRLLLFVLITGWFLVTNEVIFQWIYDIWMNVRVTINIINSDPAYRMNLYINCWALFMNFHYELWHEKSFLSFINATMNILKFLLKWYEFLVLDLIGWYVVV